MCVETINYLLELERDNKKEITTELACALMPGLTVAEAGESIRKAYEKMYVQNETARLERKLKALEEEKKELNEKIWKTKVVLHKLKNKN